MTGDLVKQKVRRWKREFACKVLSEGGLEVFSLFAGLLSLSFLADYAFSLTHWVRWVIWVACVVCVAWVAFSSMVLPILGMKSGGVIESVCRKWPWLSPYLLSGWELSLGLYPEGVSPALAREHVRELEERLAGLPAGRQAGLGISPGGSVFGLVPPPRKLLAGGVGALALGLVLALSGANPSVLPRVLSPWRDIPLESIVGIQPGTVRLPWGSSVDIVGIWKEAKKGRLKLKMRTPSSPWRIQPWHRESGGEFVYHIDDLCEIVDYRLAWKDSSSRSYRLFPVPYPHFRKMRIRVVWPSYTRNPPEEFSEPRDIEVLKGSRLEISGWPDQDLQTADFHITSLPEPVKMAPTKGEYAVSVSVTGSAEFYWSLLSAEGLRDPRPAVYRLTALDDEPPTIELLSPALEVEASPQEGLSLTYEAVDDYGLESVELLYERLIQPDVGGGGAILISRFGDMRRKHLGDAVWDLSGFAPGSRLFFELQVTDNNVLGPRKGMSQRGIVRVVDFQSQHESVQRELPGIIQGLSRLAEKEEGLASKLGALWETPTETERKRLEAEVLSEASALRQEWKARSSEFAEWVEEFEQDPYANPGLVIPYRALSNNMESLRKGKLEEGIKSVKDKEWKNARAEHKFLASEVRKSVRTLARGTEIQAMQDFWSKADKLSSQSQDLTSTLEGLSECEASGARASSQAWNELQKILEKIQRQIEEMAARIRALPKPEPGSAEEKRRRVYTVPLGSAHGLARELEKALRARDLERAIEIARRLSERLGEVQQAVADAQSAMSGEMFGEDSVARQMEEVSVRWRELVHRQSSNLQNVQGIEDMELKAKLKAQKKLLENLAGRQENVIALSTSPRLAGILPSEVLTWMKKVGAEFKSGQVFESGDLLDRTVKRLKGVFDPNHVSSAAISSLLEAERGVLESFNLGVSKMTPDEDLKAAFSEISQDQKEIKGLTDDLRSDLETLISSAPLLPASLTDTLGEASDEMRLAYGALDIFSSQKAVGHAARALELLDDGLESLDEAISQQQQMQCSMGLPQSAGRPGIRPMRVVAGRTGVRTGFVPLPAAKDYAPPADIRSEIKSSLQEKYPRSYEPVIKGYFKRLSE